MIICLYLVHSKVIINLTRQPGVVGNVNQATFRGIVKKSHFYHAILCAKHVFSLLFYALSTTKSIKCEECLPGQFADVSAMTKCLPCEAGKRLVV